jgi:hypothetical protein
VSDLQLIERGKLGALGRATAPNSVTQQHRKVPGRPAQGVGKECCPQIGIVPWLAADNKHRHMLKIDQLATIHGGQLWIALAHVSADRAAPAVAAACRQTRLHRWLAQRFMINPQNPTGPFLPRLPARAARCCTTDCTCSQLAAILSRPKKMPAATPSATLGTLYNS